MYQVWSKSIEGCWFSSVHKDVTGKNLTRWHWPLTWPWKSIGFQALLRTKYVPSLVKIHWRMLILEFTRMLHGKKFDRLTVDLWPWKSTGFQTLLRTKYVPSLVKIHWRMLILECSQGCYTVKNLPSDLDRWPMTLKISRVPDSLKD
jgi:hypothetical protein